MLRAALKSVALPPLSLFLLALLGLCLRRRRPRLGRALLASAACLLVLLTLPVVADTLLIGLQTHRALPETAPLQGAGGAGGVGAVVVLSAGLDRAGFEYGGPTVGPKTLLRLRYGAALSRRTGLPILTSGGILDPGTPPVAGLMESVLENEFGVDVRWVERQSRNTRENARFSAALLKADGISAVLLVTQAWHMPRAVLEFEATGLKVIPAPCGFTPELELELAAFVPSANALERSRWAIHEWLGQAWYALTR